MFDIHEYLPFIMPIYTTLAGIVIGYLANKVHLLNQKRKDLKKEEEIEIESIKAGIAIILRKHLYEYYTTYEYQDSIPASEWSEIEETHKVYNKLGGNHTGDRLYESMKNKHLEGGRGE